MPAEPVVAVGSLRFVQDGLHNCGTVSMLISWVSLHPNEAARMVRRLPNGAFRVDFAVGGEVTVTPKDLAAARKVKVTTCPENNQWSQIVLTAFAILKNGGKAPNFKLIEWMDASEFGYALGGQAGGYYFIKPEVAILKDGRPKLGAPVPLETLHRKLLSLRGLPLTAYTNRRIHIWSVLAYDGAKRRVQVRNPRRRQAVWMPLADFRDKYELLVFNGAP